MAGEFTLNMAHDVLLGEIKSRSMREILKHYTEHSNRIMDLEDAEGDNEEEEEREEKIKEAYEDLILIEVLKKYGYSLTVGGYYKCSEDKN